MGRTGSAVATALAIGLSVCVVGVAAAPSAPAPSELAPAPATSAEIHSRQNKPAAARVRNGVPRPARDYITHNPNGGLSRIVSLVCAFAVFEAFIVERWWYTRALYRLNHRRG